MRQALGGLSSLLPIVAVPAITWPPTWIYSRDNWRQRCAAHVRETRVWLIARGDEGMPSRGDQKTVCDIVWSLNVNAIVEGSSSATGVVYQSESS